VAYDLIRQRVPFLENDDVMYPHIQAVHQLVVDGTLVREVNRALGDE
jgi:histidine ammonia-lyase